MQNRPVEVKHERFLRLVAGRGLRLVGEQFAHGRPREDLNVLEIRKTYSHQEMQEVVEMNRIVEVAHRSAWALEMRLLVVF